MGSGPRPLNPISVHVLRRRGNIFSDGVLCSRGTQHQSSQGTMKVLNECL